MLKDLWKVLRGELSSSKAQMLYIQLDEKRIVIAEQHRLIRNSINPLLLGLGRVIAKLDPIYGKDHLDPKRKEESDRLGEEVIERLKGEAEMQRRQRDEL